jgi:N6-adenosine-specific RNA methylase IME4
VELVKYRTIVADPPWRYDNGTVPQGGVEHRYSTMAADEILALPVAEMTEPNAHLYLWVTNLHLREGRPFEIMEAWGFRYVTMLTWHKLGAIGLGYYFRGETEHVLFGVRGKAPLAVKDARNHFAATKGRHSAKPDRFYEIVERVSPGPYLELFARRRRYGWDVWGNEAPTEQASQAVLDLEGAA